MAAITLPHAFPLVGLSLSATLALNAYQQTLVNNARKASGITYPNMYASDAEAKADPKKFQFNCAQRGHNNTLESAPYVLALTIFLAFFHPKLATSCNLLWVVGRVFYAHNYVTKGPAKRNSSLAVIHYLGVVGLFFSSLYVGGTSAVRILL